MDENDKENPLFPYLQLSGHQNIFFLGVSFDEIAMFCLSFNVYQMTRLSKFIVD